MPGLTRRGFLKQAAAGAVLGAAAPVLAQAAVQRLNVLWITCEDLSPHLGCYGDPDADTPNLDRLASEGVRFTRAFSVAGVCAPSRSCLITGMYPTTLGTCHMRCKNPPPEEVRCFPAYLRRAGYYCTNNVKTDYNFDVPADAWDDSSNKAHWRNRPSKDAPFFSVFNFTTTHESQMGNLDSLPEELAARIAERRHDPAKVTLPPFYPDTELIRKHWAHLHDLATAMDLQAGDILRQLAEDGLAENTLVFFFSDHGDGLPECKRWMYDRGLRVPFIVRWPGRLDAGKIEERLVSFVDFAPTVLSVTGAPTPGHLQGRAFLGDTAGWSSRQQIFAARDRMDERYDLIRAVRNERYKYIRNYEPRRPYAQYLSYPESFPVMQELRRVEREGMLNEAQRKFFAKTKPIEELYDTETDPHELRNLIQDDKHAPVLEELRKALDGESRDLGFVPETELPRWLPGRQAPNEAPVLPEYRAPDQSDARVFGRSLREWLDELNESEPLGRMRAMAAIGLGGPEATGVLIAGLTDPYPGVAYWAALGLPNCGEASPEMVQALTAALALPSLTVRLAAARALCEIGHSEAATPVALEGMAHEDFAVRLLAVDVLERVAPRPEAVTVVLNAALEDQNDYVQRIARRALGLPPKR
ncbi:MAG: sulfatase-like hydrolase/transferase [FCB group bacterium]|jgi:uncharacterized sulfatase|nr:sulfatase-like hydrolase/transferase [FCB group bacterium]